MAAASMLSVEPGALNFSAAGHLYATHSLHAFAARCPPPLARWAVEELTEPGDHVLDPMCGSGTTLVEAMLTGRRGMGADIDPLARLVALAKAVPVPPEHVVGLAETVEDRIGDVVDDGWRPDLPDLAKWFRPEVAGDLARLRIVIQELTPDGSALRRLAWTVLSSLIVARTSVANARDLVHSRHHYREWTEDPGTVDRFIRRLRRAARLMQDLAERLSALPRPHLPATMVGEDARNLRVATGQVDLVFFSPPYVSALDYPRANMFAVGWLADVLGLSVEDYRLRARQYVGTERAALALATPEQPLPPATDWPDVDAMVDALAEAPAKAWIVHRYFADMGRVLAECSRVVRPGGHVVLVVCPSNIRKVPIPTHALFASIAGPASAGRLSVAGLAERTIHDHRRLMPYLESAFGERMRTEYVLVLRRGPGSGGHEQDTG
jgi:SAM-dependent methyltransferase